MGGYGGIQTGMHNFADALRERWEINREARDKKAQTLGQQAQRIADNVVNQFGPQLDPGKELTIENLSQVPGAKPYIDQLQQITQQHNALFQPHEAPLLVRSIEKFFGRTPKTTPASNQMTPEGELLEAPVKQSSKQEPSYDEEAAIAAAEEKVGHKLNAQDKYDVLQKNRERANSGGLTGQLGEIRQALQVINDPASPAELVQAAHEQLAAISEQNKKKATEPTEKLPGTLGELATAREIVADTTGKYSEEQKAAAQTVIDEHDPAKKQEAAQAASDRTLSREQQMADIHEANAEKLRRETQAKQEYSRAQTAATRAKSYIAARNTIQDKLTAKKTALSKVSSGLVSSIEAAIPGTETSAQKESLTNEITALEAQYQQADTMANGQLAAYEQAYGAAEDAGNTAGLPDPVALRGEGSGPKPGTVEGGYRFKGGDPADQKNWVAVK